MEIDQPKHMVSEKLMILGTFVSWTGQAGRYYPQNQCPNTDFWNFNMIVSLMR